MFEIFEIFEIERFEIKRGILPRAPTNVQGTELLVRDREIFEIEGSRDREILLYERNAPKVVADWLSNL